MIQVGQFKVDVAEYLINNRDGLKEKLEPEVRKIFVNYQGFLDTELWGFYFDHCKLECNILLVNELYSEFKYLTYDELWSIVDEELVIQTLGPEYYEVRKNG